MKTDILESYNRPLQVPNIQSNERVVMLLGGNIGTLKCIFSRIFLSQNVKNRMI